MRRSTRPGPLRATAVAFALTAASLTTVACRSDVADEGVEREVEEDVKDAEQRMEEGTDDANDGG